MTPEQFARGFINTDHIPREDVEAFRVVYAAVLFNFKHEVRRAFLAKARDALLRHEWALGLAHGITEAPNPIYAGEGEFVLTLSRNRQEVREHVYLLGGSLEKETSWRARDHYNLSMHVCPRPHDGSLYPLRMRVGIDELVACDIGPTMKKLEKWVQPFVASVCRSALTMLHRLEVYNSQEALCARLQEACTEARPQADALGVRLSVEGTRSTCVVTVTPTRDEPRGAGTGDAGPARTTPPLQLEFPPEQVDTAPERALQVWLIDWVPFHARLSKGNIKLRHQPRYP